MWSQTDSRPGVAALAFVAGLQQLPPLQRTALVLRDVLGFSAGESASILETTEASVKGALQRARAALAQRPIDSSRAPVPDWPQEREIVARFAEAVERGDTEAVVALLADDAWVTTPPYPFEYQGIEAITVFLDDRARLRGAPLRVVPTRANGQPAFGCYLDDHLLQRHERLRALRIATHAPSRLALSERTDGKPAPPTLASKIHTTGICRGLPPVAGGLLPDGTIQRGVPFSALGFLRAAGSTSGGRAAGNAATMKAKRENTPTVCAQAALAIVVKPIPATKQAIASLGSRPGASAASRERA